MKSEKKKVIIVGKGAYEKISSKLLDRLQEENVEVIMGEKERGITIEKIIYEKMDETAAKISDIEVAFSVERKKDLPHYHVPKKIGKICKGFIQRSR